MRGDAGRRGGVLRAGCHGGWRVPAGYGPPCGKGARRARAMGVNSPSNPTGWTARAEELRAVLDVCRATGTWLIADEVYNRLVYDGPRAASILDICTPHDRVLVVGSFSKAWAMTGFRIGWLIVPAETRDGFSELVEITHSGCGQLRAGGGVGGAGRRGVRGGVPRLLCAGPADDCGRVGRAGACTLGGAAGRVLRVYRALGWLAGQPGIRVAAGARAWGGRGAWGARSARGARGICGCVFAQSGVVLERALGRLEVGLR